VLEDLVSLLGKEAEKKLAVRPDVRWDEASVWVKERAVGKVMAELAELFNYYWADEETGTTLYQPVRSRGLEQERQRQWYSGAISELAAYAQLVSRPPEYYRQLREGLHGKPLETAAGLNLERLSHPEIHPGLRLLSALTRDQLSDIMSSEQYYLPWTEMTPSQQTAALQVADAFSPDLDTPSYLRTHPVPDARRWVREFGLVLEITLRPRTNRAHMYELFVGNAVLECGIHITPPDPKSTSATDMRGSPYVTTQPGRGHAPESDATRYADLERIPFPAKGFRQTIPSGWLEAFRQLGERLAFSLYSDHFRTLPLGWTPSPGLDPREVSGNPPPLPLDKLSIASGLDELCARFGKIWWRHKDALFFRSRTWFLDRSYEVPRPVVTALRQQLSSTGRLDTRSVDLLAGLNPYQLAGVGLLAGEEAGGHPSGRGYMEFRMYRPLRLYAALTRTQKEKALSERGLAFGDLTQLQQRAYQETLFVGCRPVEELAVPPRFRLEQAITPGIPGKKPSLCALEFTLDRGAAGGQTVPHKRDRLGDLFISFPSEKTK
jgi:hypothetical protein